MSTYLTTFYFNINFIDLYLLIVGILMNSFTGERRTKERYEETVNAHNVEVACSFVRSTCNS